MPQDFFDIEKGLQLDSSVTILTGTGIPGSGDSATAIAGSLFLDQNGLLWVKTSVGTGTDKWERADQRSRVSWRDPVRIKDDTVFVSLAAAETELNTTNLFDGVSLVEGDRVLLDGLDISEETEITTVADIAGSLGGTYFFLDSTARKYYVWIDVDNGSVDPVLAGRIGIEVDITANDTADVVASAVTAAIDALADFNASTGSPADLVTITNVFGGNVEDTVDSSAFPTSFSFSTTIQGAGQNVYIVTGTPVAGSPLATLVEDTNLVSDGDVIYVREGTTQADTIWNYTGSDWIEFPAELEHIRNFIGKTGSGVEFPDYSSTVHVTDGDNLETAIGDLDAVLGRARQEFTFDNQTGPVIVDAVLVDTTAAVIWHVYARDNASPDTVQLNEIHAVHDGTPSADAVTTDFSVFAKLKLNGNINGYGQDVILNGAAGTQELRLELDSSVAVDYRIIREVINF